MLLTEYITSDLDDFVGGVQCFEGAFSMCYTVRYSLAKGNQRSRAVVMRCSRDLMPV
jgi:hypothetical protein